jgi:glycolate oxidase FAD binding subunit
MSRLKQILPVTHVVTPPDEAAVARAVGEAARDGTAVYPVGGATSLAYGVRPVRPGIALSTARLAAVVSFPASDMTVTVQAGLTIAELNKRLASARQWLPIDVPQPELATIGGVVAANIFGPRRFGYGTIRDYVLGFRAVDGQGEVFCGGGQVVKNAAGYNLPRTLVGSLGTLGVITELTLMVQPLPQDTAILACDVRDFEGAECLLAGLSRSRTLPVAIELLAGRSRPGCPLPPLPAGVVARLLIGFDGSQAEVEWMVRQLRKEWETAGRPGGQPLAAAANVRTLHDTELERTWTWLADCSGHLLIHVLPSETVALVQELTRLAPGASIQAHAGSGVIRMYWSRLAPSASDGEMFTADLREKLRPAVVGAGGSLVVLDSPDGAELASADVWGLPTDGADVMQSLRSRFDPKGILNPGRFIFGNP